jgi:predicted transcriptional regulator
MKVAISLPDSVFQAAENLARRLNKPRSRLYAEAIADYVGTHESDAVTARLDAVYGTESGKVDAALQHAQAATVNDAAW